MGNSKVFYILQTKAYPTQNVQKHAIASSRASRRPIRSLAFWRAFLAANGRTPRRWAYRPDGRPMGRRDLSAFACCPFSCCPVLGQCGLPHKHPVGGVGILLPFCTPKPWTAASFLGVHLYEGLGTHCERGHALCMHGSRVVRFGWRAARVGRLRQGCLRGAVGGTFSRVLIG